MLIVDKEISMNTILEMSQNHFGDLVKTVVDIKRGIMAVDAEMHCDEEQFLLEKGSEQDDLWGINLYPQKAQKNFANIESWVEFDSMINLRPSWGNKTRGVDDLKIQKKILSIVKTLVKK
ncbi:hypothetical protein KAU11_02095 [Candidatus Babeliales bacterium]|nr:hypothetical protein [Candidatus Babeliales bacterium]